ncbi:hypothetical protein EC991_007904 [Linnemannia zychae]|nr:hypothetical protein EC991_007904 [Linnemannia zychae]
MDGLNRASDCLTQPPFTALKEFHIFGGYGFFSINRMAFLARCVNLESVWLEDVDNWFIDLVSYYFQFFCQRLTSLRLADSFGLVDQSIARILRASVSGWKELRLPSMEKFGPLSFEVLKRSTVTLEILEVEHWGVLDTRCFMDLLCNAGKLRRLGGIPDKGMDFEIVDVTVHAYCAFLEHSQGKNDLTWALGPSMEHLQMQIGGVPRPDVACRLNGGRLHLEPNGDIDASRRYDVQRWIYEQLGRMTGLQELLLGILDQNWDFYDGMGMDVNPEWNEQELEEALMGIYITFQYHCLEFSLESGLELLSGLKELRVLDIRSTAHRIGVPELEWMNVKWPKLKEVKGIGAEGMVRMPEGWLKLRGVKGLESKRECFKSAEDGPTDKSSVDALMVNHPRGIGLHFIQTPE